MISHRRVRPPEILEELNGTLIDRGPFESKQKALMYSSSVGVYIDRRSDLSSPGEPIRWEIFERNGDDTFIYALAVWEKGNLEILKEGDEFIEIFEEYANSGLRYLENSVLDETEKTLDQLIHLTLDMSKKQKDYVNDLKGISQSEIEELL